MGAAGPAQWAGPDGCQQSRRQTVLGQTQRAGKGAGLRGHGASLGIPWSAGSVYDGSDWTAKTADGIWRMARACLRYVPVLCFLELKQMDSNDYYHSQIIVYLGHSTFSHFTWIQGYVIITSHIFY